MRPGVTQRHGPLLGDRSERSGRPRAKPCSRVVLGPMTVWPLLPGHRCTEAMRDHRQRRRGVDHCSDDGLGIYPSSHVVFGVVEDSRGPGVGL